MPKGAKGYEEEFTCQERLGLISSLIKVGYWELNIKTNSQNWSDEVFSILGEEAQSFDPKMENFMQFLSQKDQTKMRAAIEHAMATHEPYDLYHEVVRKDKSVRKVHARAKLILDEKNEPSTFFGTVIDITEEARLQQEAQKTLHTLNSVIDNVENLIFYKDTSFCYMGCNSAFEAFYGHTREEIIGHDDFDFLPKELTEHFRKLDTLVIEKHQKVINPQWVKYPDGRDVFLHTTTAPFFDTEGNLLGLVGNAVDLTKEKILSDQLGYMAHYDDLTDMPNRHLFMDRLEQAVVHAKRNEKIFALFFIDLDGFKSINDLYGHAYGDAVLKEVSRRLKNSLRVSDTVARLGGDEFGVILSNVVSKEAACEVARKLICVVDEPIEVGGTFLRVTLSVGIAFSPEDAQHGDTLLSLADHAMYTAKKNGKNRYALAALF